MVGRCLEWFASWYGFVARLSHVGFVVLLMMMVICFGNVPFPPLVEIRENPEFRDLMRMDKGHWPRCLLWHGWLPMLSGVPGASPWAASAESAVYCLRVLLALTPSDIISRLGLSLKSVDWDSAATWMSQISLMFGLMVVLFVMRFLVLPVLVLVFYARLQC